LFLQYMATGMKPLCQGYRQYGQTTTTASQLTFKEEGLRFLLRTDGVILNMFNCWLSVSAHLVYQRSSPVSPVVCDIINSATAELQKQRSRPV